MKESILRAAAIASLALALIMSVTTWIGVSTSSQRGSVLIGFFEFALILFLGAVAWALFNAFADIVTSRNTLEMLTVRLVKLEEAVARIAPATDTPATDTPATDAPTTDAPTTGSTPEAATQNASAPRSLEGDEPR